MTSGVVSPGAMAVWAGILEAYEAGNSLPDAVDDMDLAEIVARAVGLHDHTPTLIKERIVSPDNGDVLVLYPRDADDVAAAVHALRSRHQEFIVAGALSNVTGNFLGSPNVVLSTVRLAGVSKLDDVSLTVTVGSGTLGGELEAWLSERGLTLALFPQSLHMSTVGGWLATRATGSLSARLGGIENAVVGGTVVTARGEVLEFLERARPAGGVDGLSLFVGAEGSLGIFTAVTLKVYRAAEERVLCFAFGSFAAVINAQRELMQGEYPVNLVRGYNLEESGHILGEGSRGDYLLIVSTLGPEELLEHYFNAIADRLIALGGKRLADDAAAKWFRDRYKVKTMMEDRNVKRGRFFDTIEASVPWSQATACVAEIEDVVGAHVTNLHIHTSHAYRNGVGFYVLVWLDEADDAEGLLALRGVWSEVMAITRQYAGMIGHHHGIGEMRRREYAALPDAAVHRTMKAAFDPEGLLYARLLES